MIRKHWSHRCILLLLFSATAIYLLIFSSRLTTEKQPSCQQSALIAANHVTQHPQSQSLSSKTRSRRQSQDTVCDNDKCAVKLLAESDGVEKIPKIRHILWKSDKMPRYFANQLATWQRLMPNWQFVLWTDQDLKPFVAKHYSGMLPKFNSISKQITKLDLVRYLLVHRFGGVYADVDYMLANSIDNFTGYPCVLTVESEAHSITWYGMKQWPLKKLLSPALFMATPGHGFLQFCIEQLRNRKADNFFRYAGPMGLTDIFYSYSEAFPLTASRHQQVYIPPSYSFYPYDNNSLLTSTSSYQSGIRTNLKKRCSERGRAKSNELDKYCQNVTDLTPITDGTVKIYAVHDNKKKVSTYDGNYKEIDNVPIRSVVPDLVMGSDWL